MREPYPTEWLAVNHQNVNCSGRARVCNVSIVNRQVSFDENQLCVCVCVNVNIWLDLFVNVNKGNKRPPERQNKWMKKKRKML